MKVKEELYKTCEIFVENRLKNLQQSMNDIQKAMLSETKSSAGDKHEIGRAMLQLEREQLGVQLLEIQKVKEALYQIDVSKPSQLACSGSVVFTTQANYFIAISAGEITFENNTFYAISPHTPIGQLLISQKVNDKIVFRDQKFKITKVI